MIDLTMQHVLNALYLLLSVSFLIIVLIFMQKRRHRRHAQRVAMTRQYIFDKYFDKRDVPFNTTKHYLLSEFINVQEQIRLPQDVYGDFLRDITTLGFIRFFKKRLSSPLTIRRKEAAFYLGYVQTVEVKETLVERLKKETDETVRFYIVNALKNRLDDTTLIPVLESLIGASESYNETITSLLVNQPLSLEHAFDHFRYNYNYAIIRFFMKLAKTTPSPQILAYVTRQFKWTEQQRETKYDPKKDYATTPREAASLHRLAADVLAVSDPEVLDEGHYYFHHDPYIVEQAYKALAHGKRAASLKTIVSHIDGTEYDSERLEALKTMVANNPKVIPELIRMFAKTDDERKRTLITEALASRIEYLIFQAVSSPSRTNIDLLKAVVEHGLYYEMIGFLNQNKDSRYEHEVLSFLSLYLDDMPELENELRVHLKKDILEKLGLSPLAPPQTQKPSAKEEKDKKRYLRRWLYFALLIFPLIFFLHQSQLGTFAFDRDTLEDFVVAYNLYIVIYYIVVNSLYVLLTLLSHYGAKRQIRLWRIKRPSMLYEKNLLPKVSILAPAYNEELSIKESVTSLLNLKYPSYEVVVINDGSKDNTLKTLIDHFNLERHHHPYQSYVTTRPIRGIYTSKKIPNLVVVDKQNGGKADALNVGVNVARNEYLCGIDADSVLEDNALLKLISVTLDSTKETIALGGNIHPSNGARIHQGKVEENKLPTKTLVKLQSLEYLRAFTTGRIGWARLKSLLIISGAFGVFERDALIEAGGYLTSVSSFNKDTVGEDMEIVVRMNRNAHAEKKRFNVDYVFNAVCYTELPDEMRGLLKQRNRWHRGLIDILSYHRRMTFNPAFKQVGMLGFPYFLIFEMVGPLLEIQAYFMLITALALGLLNPPIILLIFIATVVFGIVVSLISLFILEKDRIHFTKKETFILVLFAILENFGYRQLISLYRVRGYFSALKESHEWGEQKRKGFKT